MSQIYIYKKAFKQGQKLMFGNFQVVSDHKETHTSNKLTTHLLKCQCGNEMHLPIMCFLNF